MIVTGIKMAHFVCKVMAFCVSKDSRCFLYNGSDLNQVSKRFELFAKKNEANNKKGVVGKTGITAPKHASARNRKAKTK